MKDYLHIFKDYSDWDVMHSVHSELRLGGQVLRGFGTREQAVEFARNIRKNEIICVHKKTWKQIHDEFMKGVIGKQ